MLQVLFIGNLAADAVVYANGQDKFLSFRAASSRRYRDQKTGQVVEQAQWVTVNVNHNYENYAQYLVKGTKVFVEGSLSTRIYTDRSQIQQVGITINALRLELCGGPQIPSQQAGQAAAQYQPQPVTRQAPAQQTPINYTPVNCQPMQQPRTQPQTQPSVAQNMPPVQPGTIPEAERYSEIPF